MKLFVINGPNLNMLGIREKHLYGNRDYAALEKYVKDICSEENIDVEIYQSNYEGKLVEIIQSAYENADGIVINPAAYTHTSVAILDALKSVALPCVEVHLTDVSKREDFRQISYARLACEKTYAGYGFEGYKMAIEYLKQRIKEA